MATKPLTSTEQQILEQKATEHPFSGRFLYLTSTGDYCCRRCQTPLYRSDSKFDAGCGWPSFDDEIAGAVEREVDADGRRTEILCANCGGHLGHVFEGEQLTAKNVRHCVNAQALAFTPRSNAETLQYAIFGGGCFWCLEAVFQRVDGVNAVQSGYCGGDANSANYRDVCSGATEHIEVVRIQFDPEVVSYGQLLELFFDCHDPCSWDQQGADKGSQYRSAIFCSDIEQRHEAEAFIKAMQRYLTKKIVTVVADEQPFYPAEAEHDDYYQRNGDAPYCQWNIAPKLAKLFDKYADRIK